MDNKITGYKVFEPDWTCIDFKYEVGKTYHTEGEVEIHERGFHFCQRLTDCYNYYKFDPKNRAAIVEASGIIILEDRQCCTDTITIVRELSWGEILSIVDAELSDGKSKSRNFRHHA